MTTEHPEKSSRHCLLRHALATLVYRGSKALRNAPDGFAQFRIGSDSRTPLEILTHIGDLFDWAAAMAAGEHIWNDSKPGTWTEEIKRFHGTIGAFDDVLARNESLGLSPELLFQGPVADAFTHVGQIAMLRRLAGSPIRGENFSKADIRIGRLGPDQIPARVEFE